MVEGGQNDWRASIYHPWLSITLDCGGTETKVLMLLEKQERFDVDIGLRLGRRNIGPLGVAQSLIRRRMDLATRRRAAVTQPMSWSAANATASVPSRSLCRNQYSALSRLSCKITSSTTSISDAGLTKEALSNHGRRRDFFGDV
jgi:hypothetical protein